QKVRRRFTLISRKSSPQKRLSVRIKAKKARSFNMTEVDFSIAGISSAFAPVPVFNKESSNSGDTTLLSPKSSAQAIISAPSPTKKNYQNSPPDSPSPQRKLKKAKSPEDSEPPKGYYEAKQNKMTGMPIPVGAPAIFKSARSSLHASDDARNV
uniref:Uncharacterized protein n=2 Tax=Caenorhabditis japonica TaxID=281687 RepID=A0A8R1EFN7_CAEJA